MILAVRWGTVLVAAALAISSSLDRADLVAFALIIANAIARTRLPIKARPSNLWGLAEVTVEVAATVVLVITTGFWSSPFFFCLVAGVVAAGFARGLLYAVPLAALAALAIAVPSSFRGQGDVAQLATTGTSELLLVALVAGYARRLFGEAEQRASQVLSRLSRLNEANALLLQLNQVAQTLPASLDLAETLGSTIEQLRTMIRPDLSAILLWDSSLRRWSQGAAEGVRLASIMTDSDLPEPLRRAARYGLRERGASLVDLATDGPGLGSASRSAIYVPLVSRDILVGMLAVETQASAVLGTREVALMTGLAEQAALAIDNAQWFGRLRTLGAEEERTRIARDLHDRVAQSLAYLAFELDRITAVAATQPVHRELETLRHDVRQVVTEVRDTLYDLRTNVTENQDLVDTLEGFLERVRTRSGLEIRFEHHVTRRLPLPLEREFWRIAQEAVTNAEHHAKAQHLVVVWEAHGGQARLHVIDDGRGFPVGSTGRMDSYGLLGMRERADAIGATLEIESAPGQGTAVHCRLETS